MPSAGRSPSVVPSRAVTRTSVRAAATLAVVGLGLLVAGMPAAAAPTPAVTATPDRTDGWDWPVEGPWGPFGPPPPVLRGFDPPAQTWLPGHRGVDLGAWTGATVVAAGAGVVVYAGPLAGRGVVSVQHPGGLRTTYEPVAASVTAGESVSRGQPLGTLDPLTAHCGATCLHWGLRLGETYLDPLSLVAPQPPVLLPYGPPVPAPVPPYLLVAAGSQPW